MLSDFRAPNASPRSRHQLGRHAQDPLATPDQKPLERARDMPTVLQRPHPLAAEAPRPCQQRSKARGADLDRLLAHELASHRRQRDDRVRALVRVRPEHDHDLVHLHLDWWTPGGHGLLRALPRSYQVTPDIPDRRRATQQKEVRPPADSIKESQLAAGPGPSPRHRTSPTPAITTASLAGAVRRQPVLLFATQRLILHTTLRTAMVAPRRLRQPTIGDPRQRPCPVSRQTCCRRR
jgi:hypothetical protein